MKNGLRNLFVVGLPILASFFVALPARAVCPVCTVLATSGVGLSRWLGVDDLISGLWIGGLTVSATIWTIEYARRNNIKFKGAAPAIAAMYYILILGAFYYVNLISDPIGTICSCVEDKLFLGIATGSFGFWAGAEWYDFIKAKNGGKARFPFQKVVMPLIPLLATSVLFYFLIK